ncbi:UDP-MurNAc hydroxylase [Natrinema hispanicum]|uniref:UDP-MurNAc hydroxylase n=1 Tax=Natrinema hispanicum TaxID=392421 RepID=A0A1G6T267_9EURY|nr:UDP-MurNAc hydroxylase [Natrinema hispanicum]SEU00430.1 UDP-MurNAc hydroxylase [Natrinema hispanicum]
MQDTERESAAVPIKDDDTSVLCDPWVLNGAHYGS